MVYLKIEDVQKDLNQTGFQIFTALDFTKHFKIQKGKANAFLSRNTQRGYFTRLKKGFYYITNNPPSVFNIANIVYRPSYISVDTALSYYKIIPETIYSVTSITSKHSKSMIINNQEYKYHKLDKKLYFGYKLQTINSSNILIAEKEKALLDYIYFIARGNREMNDRINLSSININLLMKHFQFFKKNVKNIYFVKEMELIIDKLK